MLVEVNISEKKFGNNNEEYYNTDNANTIASIIKYKSIEVLDFVYTNCGMQWENVDKENGIIYYIYI